LQKFLVVLASHRQQLEAQLREVEANLEEVKAHEKETRALLAKHAKKVTEKA
jgi:energy-converting hydrogenase Eha subunit H